jgi:nucleoid-associated protein YgaU
MSPRRLTEGFGRIICLAYAVLATTASAQGATHTVQPGDTLWDLSRQHLASPLRWPEVQSGNGVAKPELLQPGKVLTFLPHARVAEVSGKAWIKLDPLP